jgi:hypothetical protein
MSEGFFDRWSRRKQEARVEPEQPLPEDPPLVPVAAAVTPAEVTPAEVAVTASDEAPPPTLADTAMLTIDSDFKPFLARNVAPEVKNAAFKKLFADPHFNVMDRLDIYIDDYSIPSPLPESVLRQMASAKFLKLFDDDEATEVPPQDVAQSEPFGEPPSPPVAALQPASQDTDDHHADLRLQPDHAPRSESDREGPG